MKTALISGATGQDGAFLSQLLLKEGYKVIGATRRTASGSAWRLDKLKIKDQVELIDFELTEPSQAEAMIREYKPNLLFNLAAMSFVGASWNTPVSTMHTNAMGVTYLLEAIRRHSPSTRFYQASTSEMFGGRVQNARNEDSPLHPRSPYGVAKLAAHWMCINYRESYDLSICTGILFNHESELRGSEFVTKKIAEYVGKYYRFLKDSKNSVVDIAPLKLGNIYAKRDWGYAKDYVEAMYRMTVANTPKDYVVATGQTHTVKEFVTLAFAQIGVELAWLGEGVDEYAIDLDGGKVVVKISEEFYRPAEVNYLKGDASLIKKDLGWEPKTKLAELVNIMVRNELEKSYS